MRVESFAPVMAPGARLLILGSMPGVESLRQQRYYAHPRNQFWPIMASILGMAPEASYAERLQALQEAGVALWDVLKHCERPGSLDSSIVATSEFPNDIPGLLQANPGIRVLAFNGRKAESTFQRHLAARSRLVVPDLNFLLLPSTSPAHAAMSAARKAENWQTLLLPHLAYGDNADIRLTSGRKNI